jgi:hypothetical protein
VGRAGRRGGLEHLELRGPTRSRGRIAPAEKIRIRSAVAPGRAFLVVVSTVDPPHRPVLTRGMPLGVFRGVRTGTLTPTGAGATTFVMREEFSGPLLGLIGRSIPDLQPSFTPVRRRAHAAGRDEGLTAQWVRSACGRAR